MALRGSGSGTTHAITGTQTTHAHGVGGTPDFVAITSKGNGVVYLSSLTDATNIYIKGSAASLIFDFMAMVDHSIIK